MSASPFRNLPSVNEVLKSEPVQALAASFAHDQIVAAIRVTARSLISARPRFVCRTTPVALTTGRREKTPALESAATT